MNENKQFTARLLVPIALVAALTMMAVGSFVWWSAGRVDESELLRERHLLERAIEQQKEQMTLAQTGVAIWDDTVSALEKGDIAWLVDNLGTYHYDAYGYERAIVVDHALNPVMSVIDGGSVPAQTARSTIGALAPLFEPLKSIEAEAHISAFNKKSRAAPPSALAFAIVEDKPALVGIMPILSYSRTNAPAPGTEAYLVTVAFLDAELASKLASQYRIARPEFVAPTEPPQQGEASLLISAADNRPVAELRWSPERPGTDLLSSATPALLAAFIVGLGIIAFLLRGLHNALHQLRTEREEASHNALHDPLTGLGNRALFNSRLPEKLRAMPRGSPRLALLALDLDQFKEVNDTLGHSAGDDLLQQVSQRLANIIEPDHILVRLGGDEFAIIQTGIESHEEATSLAHTIIAALSAPIRLSDSSAQIGVSIGIVTAPDYAASEAELMRLADDALYRAKNEGRNRCVLYRPLSADGDTRIDPHLFENLDLRRSTH